MRYTDRAGCVSALVMYVSVFIAICLGTTAWGDVHLVVAADGSGQYTRIQDAIAAIPASPTTPYILDIKPGTYTMTNNMDQFKVTQSNVTFNGLGTSPSDVVITGSYGSDELPNDKYCHATTVILGSNFTARNVTFANTHGDNNGQALAMYAKADRLFFLNCRFLGWQDTLRTEYGRQYFKNCYVEGDVDFIYGHATAFFDNCSLYVKSNGYITAPALLEPANDYRSKGFVFYQCTITGVGTGIGYLGRPWTAGGLAVYDSCWIGPVINKAGWTGNLDGSYFAEHHSMDLNGNLLNVSNRIAGSYQLTDTQALAYSKSNWISGPDNWTPVDNTEPDTTAPTPNPMTWSVAPYASGLHSISMTATTATDPAGVQYLFICTSGGGHSSAWQNSPSYTDTGLAEGQTCSYAVKARDKSPAQNETAVSTELSATTMVDNSAPTPNPSLWSVLPTATGIDTITMKAQAATDISGVEYFFANITDSTHNSGWQDGTTYTDTGLANNTTYTYAVIARDKSLTGNETAWSEQASATTARYDCTPNISGDLNGDCRVDFLDQAILAGQYNEELPLTVDKLTNGSFDTDAVPWQITAVPGSSGYFVACFDDTTGNPVGSAVLGSDTDPDGTDGYWFYQMIPVIEGRQYKLSGQWTGDLSGFVAADPCNRGNWAEVIVAFEPSADPNTWVSLAEPNSVMYRKAFGSTNQNIDPSGAWDWEEITASQANGPADGIFTATDSHMVLAFGQGGLPASGIGYYYLDNVKVQTSPCPTWDFNGDCKLDWLDIQHFAGDWLNCNRIPTSECWQ